MTLPSSSQSSQVKLLAPAVIVAALGYFVDIYDLLLFSIVRKQSLTDLGIVGAEQMERGLLLLDLQMIGMLIGGILWGVLGDKKGRLSVLFGSIITYSIANLANAFVPTLEWYAVCRFIAGIGLAGELGVGITLVTEIMPKEKRGYATTIVASVGITGAVLAGVLAEYFSWRICYVIGGVLGLSLLALRIGVTESGMYKNQNTNTHSKGDFLALFKNGKRFVKYMRFILIGLPVWYIVGILITFSPELQKVAGIQGSITAGRAVLFCYAGLSLGDMLSGAISQWLKSRKAALYIFWTLSVLGSLLYYFLKDLTPTQFYVLSFFCGFTVGSWVIFMTVAAEQFGTNIRATVTTTVPNFVRGAVVPMTALFHFLQGWLTESGNGNMLDAALLTGALVLGMAVWAISGLTETYGKDLDYIENF
jgi:MFS family permease